MSDIDDLLAARAQGSNPGDIDSMLAVRAQGGMAPPPPPPPPAAPTAGGRFMQGLTDLPTGLGQAAEHVAETPINWLRQGIRGALNSAGFSDAASLFPNVSTDQYDQIVRQREQGYQQARAVNGQTGIDWWRLGGEAADPINYLGGGAAGTAAGRIGQAAAQGAAVSAAQPSLTPGSFWWDKAKGAATGAVAGAGIGSIVEGAMPALRAGTNWVKSTVGPTAAANSPAADQVVKAALQSQGVDPASMDLNMLGGMRQDVQSALEHDAEPSAVAIVNRARAESLPVPIRLMRGQATGDPAAFSTEQNLRGITGVGEPITERLQQQNAGFIQNLDLLGAKDAPDTVSTSQQMAAKTQSFWDDLQASKEQLYGDVRNSQGQSAAMDQFTAVKNIRAALDTPQASHAYDTLPTHIQKTISDLEDGKLELTVAQMQQLDKSWGQDARGADGSIAHTINTARHILSDAPIQDTIGDEAAQAYKLAKQAHAQQMSLVEPKLPNGQPNPNFQPLVKSVVYGKPAEADSLFNTHFLNAAPSVAQKNLAFVSNLAPKYATTPDTIGRTFMGEIKRQALSSASDERGTVSQSVLNGWANDPVKSARMDALLPKPATQTFRNLAATVEAAKRFPVASTVNTSNTGSAVVNAVGSALKSSAASQILKRLPLAKPIAEGLSAAKTQTAVQSALEPGVTLKALLSSTPSQAAARRLITQGAVPAAVSANQANQ